MPSISRMVCKVKICKDARGDNSLIRIELHAPKSVIILVLIGNIIKGTNMIIRKERECSS